MLNQPLEGLIERVAWASGPDRDLDLALATALVPDVLVMCQRDDDSGADPYTYWEYTGSVDAATGLAERLLPGAQVGLDPIFFVDPEEVKWDAIICIPHMDRWNPVNSDWIERIESRHADRCLAIILALLKALRAIQSTKTGDAA